MKNEKLFRKLFTRYLLLVAIMPNLIFTIIIYGCRSESAWTSCFSIAGLISFIPMTLYYIPPFIVSRGNGFVGQMGVGPENWIGVVIAIIFWSIVSFAIAKLHFRTKI